MRTVCTCVHVHTPAGHAVVQAQVCVEDREASLCRGTSYTQCPGEGCSEVEGGILEVSGIGGCVSPWSPVCEAHSKGFRVCFVSVLYLDKKKLAIRIPLQDEQNHTLFHNLQGRSFILLTDLSQFGQWPCFQPLEIEGSPRPLLSLQAPKCHA